MPELKHFSSASPEDVEMSYKESKGCHVKITTGFILVFLALILSLGVGLIVHFVEHDNLKSSTDSTENSSQLSPEKLTQQCKNIVEKDSSKAICQACPAASTCSSSTTTKMTKMPPTTTPSVVDNVRLPTSLKPLSYDLEIQPNLYGDNPHAFTFDGKVSIEMSSTEPMNKVTLHAKKLKIDMNSIKFRPKISGDLSYGTAHYVSMTTDEDREFLIFHLSDNLVAGKNYVLELAFSGPLTGDLKGLYLSSYQDNGQTRYLATTQFQPTDARKAFPCFDEPGFKAKFSITVVRKNGWHSLSNMNKTSSSRRGNDMIADKYEQSPDMSTYLVAFVVSQFSSTSGLTSRGIKYSAWAQPASVNQTREALMVGIKVIDFYEKFFDIEFPLPKQDMIAIPDYPLGAMENWGLITYRETAMLFDPVVSTEYNRRRVTDVIAHEVSHQWFGNLVTMGWWDDLWLNEGFATFMEYLGSSIVHPDWKMLEQFTVSELYGAFSMDGLRTSHPIYVPVNNPDEINEIFDSISYNKGGSVVRMIRFFMGDDLFLKGLQEYLKAKKYKTAFHDDLWNALQMVASRERKRFPSTIKSIMDTWIRQMNYPVVTVTQSRSGILHLEQERFLIDDTPNPKEKFTSPFNYRWSIPFTYTTSEEMNFNKTAADVKWLTGQSTDIADNALPNPYKKGAWILGNIQQYGFYRVNYARENWLALIQQLKTDHTRIADINRGQLINDAWNLARAGQVDMGIALQTLEYLDKEMSYTPWMTAKRELGYLNDMISRTELYGNFQKFMLAKVETPFKKLTLDDSNSKHIQTLLRTQIASTACGYGVVGCVAQATKLFSDWMMDPDNNKIDPDIKSSVYCTAVREGGEKEWNFALNQFKTTKTVSEKDLLMSALSCTTVPWILSHYLSLSLDPSVIRSQDTVTVIVDISRNSVGRYMAWNFIRDNWDLLRNKFGGGFFSFSNLIKRSTESFNTQGELEQLEQFVQSHTDLGTAKRAFDQAIENTKSNIKWLSKNYDTIKTWLQKVTSSTGQKVTKDVRLPRAVIPTLYDIEIKPDIYGLVPENFKFYGKISIHLDCVETANNITLHQNKLKIDQNSISVSNEDRLMSPPEMELYSEDPDRQFMIIHLKRSVMAGQKYVLSLTYEGNLEDDLAGVYRSSYQRNGSPVYMATTQMEATDARKTFPCFDEPQLKAKFKLTILRKSNKITLSNMPRVTTENRDDGYVADVYGVSEKMSTYLVCFVVCDFKGINGTTKNNITYGAWARPESIGQAKLALEVGMDTITFYEDFFGIKFPLPKQDMIAIPDFSAGAMENWGLITYRETAMLYEPGVSSSSNKQRVTTVITHELAHQWFGDLVTMEWWDDLWLNEGFATFVEYLGADNKFPEWKMFEQFTIYEVQSAFDFDSLVTSHPIYAPVADPAEINEIFDTISYSKGASIIRMMRWFLGDQTFKNGLKKYLQKRKFSNARHDDLWQSMSEQAVIDKKDINVKAIMDTWTLQMNYPVVHMSMRSSLVMTITQKRFLQNPEAKDPLKYQSPFGYVWQIPFTFTTESTMNFDQKWEDVIWIRNQSFVLNTRKRIARDEWFLGNIQQYGYYRVNYDRDNWIKLVQQLKTNHTHIHASNRGQLIHDSWSLAKSGDLEMDVALKVLEYLGAELDYVPWYAARHQLSYVRRMLTRTTLFGKLQKYAKTLLQKPFDHYGMDNSGASHIESYIRSLLVGEACDYGLEKCSQGALRMYRDWMLDPINKRINPDLKSTVYCVGIAEGGEAEWNFAFEQYKASGVAGEKTTLLAAMACTKETWILSKYLDMVINPGVIRIQDGSKVISYVASNPVGRDLAWNFVRANFQTFLDMYGSSPFAMKNLLNGVTPSFNTELDLQQLRDLQAQYPDMGTGTRAFQQIIEKTQLNLQWMKKNYGIIENWLNANLETSTQEVSDVRLPRNMVPLLYELEIFPDIYQNDPKDFKFEGKVKIWVKTLEATSNVTLHANKLSIDINSIRIGSNESALPPNDVRSTSEDKERQFFIIQLGSLLEADKVYFVEMTYTGPLKDDLVGLYYSSYKRGDKTVYMATTQMEPTDARKTLPCFDEPALKAQFKMTIVRRNDLISLSNMPRTTEENRPNDMVADVYKTSETMSTYLLCIIVCDFQSIHNTTRRGTKYGAWARPESLSQAELALQIGTETLAFYGEFFNIDFPLPKQDMIAIPDFAAGAMENWGLITYRETAMLYEPGVSSASNKQRVTVVITHELAHQWFGDLVTMDWWDDLWLNEGFATFVEYLGADHMFPDWRMFEQFTVSEIHSAFDFDGLVTSHPIYVPVSNPDQINEIFDSISYAKGGSVIRMMKHFVGDDVFRQGLTNYLNERRLKNAFHDDLWYAMGNQSHVQGKDIDVKSIMDTWILQMNYPVVTVTKLSNGKLRLSQKRFLNDPTAKDPETYVSPFNYVWKIPFTYTTNHELNFNKTFNDVIMFEGKEKDIDAKLPSDGWVLANVQQTGYYRVNYDRENWAAIANQLNVNHRMISNINRAQLINDAWALSKSGDVDMVVALNIIEYLKNEMDYIPWSAGSSELSFVSLMLKRTSLYGKFKTFMQQLIKTPFNKFGLDNTGATHIEKFTRSRLASIACSYDVKMCVTESAKLFKNWMDDPIGKRVDPDIKSTVYCTGISEGGETEWDFAYNQYKTTDVAAEQKTLLSALACTKETWLLSRYLTRALNENEIRKQDAITVIVYVSRNTIGRDLVFKFVQDNWVTIREEYLGGSFSFSNLFDGIFDGYNTAGDLEQIREFLQQHPDLGAGQRALQQAIEKTESNIKWMKEKLPIVEDWLNNVTSPLRGKMHENLRLPRAVLPELYDLELYPDIYQASPNKFKFYGNVTILVNCTADTNNITLHINRLTIEQTTLWIRQYRNNMAMGSNLFASMSEDKEKQFLILNLNQKLQFGNQYQVYMSFEGPLTDDMAGLYYSSYKRGNTTIYLAATQMEAVDARKAFPCFDEPDMKAKYKVTLLRKSNMKSLSNMKIMKTESRMDSLIADIYSESPRMSSYLLAVIVCDFNMNTTKTKNNITYNVWAIPEVINQTNLALQLGSEIITFYEKYFGINFPLVKQDMIAIPDFSAGAMENWGLITYRETAMLFEDGVSSEGNRQRVAEVIAHELAHMWFGDLVTMQWWDDLWLNEGFARLIQYLGTDHVYPDLKMFEQFVSEEVHAVLSLDSSVNSHPIYVPIDSTAMMSEIFDGISYGKGACVIRMMRFFLGEKTFKQGVHAYLNNRKYQNAFHDDLWAALDKQSRTNNNTLPASVKQIMNTWILQMNYPLITVSCPSPGTLKVTQDRFLRNPNAKDPGRYISPYGYKWWVPITYTTSAEKNFNKTNHNIHWFNQSSSEIKDPSINMQNKSDWVVVNTMQYGLYRVNYTERNWRALINQLNTDHKVISSINRAQIINDAWNLARANQLSMDIALKTVDYLAKEKEYIPRITGEGELAYIDSMLSMTKYYGKYKNFRKDLIKDIYKESGFNNTGAKYLQAFMRSHVVSTACAYELPECVNEATRQYQLWMKNSNTYKIDPGVKYTVYCTGIQEGGEEEWNFAYKQYKTSQVASERSKLLSALSCSKIPWILERFLEYAITSSEVRKQDGTSVISNVASSTIGRPIAWRFLREKWDYIYQDYSDRQWNLAGPVASVTSSFNTEFDLQQLKEFGDNHPELGRAERTYKQQIETIQNNIQWMKSNLKIIEEWLKSH